MTENKIAAVSNNITIVSNTGKKKVMENIPNATLYRIIATDSFME